MKTQTRGSVSAPIRLKRGTIEEIAAWLIKGWICDEDVACRLAKSYNINKMLIEIGKSTIH